MSRLYLEPASARPNVAGQLQQLGLERYEATFLENDVSAAILPGLPAEDVKELGMLLVAIVASCCKRPPNCVLMRRRPAIKSLRFRRQMHHYLDRPQSVASS